MNRDDQKPDSRFRPPVSEQGLDSEQTLAEAGLVELLSDPATVSAIEESPGRYTHPSEYARGGTGRILIVHDEHLGREIALKELLPGVAGVGADGKPTPVRGAMPVMARFLEEARITGQLEHPSIVPVYELGRRSDGSLYYTMKLVRGKTLAQAIRDAGDLRGRLALLSHFVDLCQAIAYAHSRGVIHRDIKPGNVMVGEFGETVVIDWGLAKVKGQTDVHAEGLSSTINTMRSGDDSDISRTMYGQAIGTPVYMPPEQARGELEKVDERSDVYSLGAVLYELITGAVPFADSSPGEILQKVANEVPAGPTAIEKDAPPELVAICGRAMQRDHARRYASAKELAEEVQRFLSGALVHTHQYKATDYLRWFARKHTVVIATAAAGFFMLLGVGVFYNIKLTRSRNDERMQRRAAEQESYRSTIMLAASKIREHAYQEAKELLLAVPEGFRHWEWGRLIFLCSRDVMCFTGHADGVESVAFSPDGGRVLAGSWDTTAKLWDTNTGEELLTLRGHSNRVTSVAFSPDGERILTGSWDTTAKLWDGRTGEEIVTLRGHTNRVTSVAYGPQGQRLLTGSFDKTAKLWNAATGVETRTFGGHDIPITSVLFSPDGQFVFTGGHGLVAKLWNVETGEDALTLRIGRAVLCTAFSPDGRRVITGELYPGISGWDTFRDRSLKLRNLETGEDILSLSGHLDSVSSVAFSADGQRILSGGLDKLAKLWDAETGDEISTFSGHSGRIRAVACSSDGRRFLTGSEDATVKLWHAETGSRFFSVGELNNEDAVAFSSDGKTIFTGGVHMDAELWSVGTGTRIRTFSVQCANAAVMFSPDGKRFLSRNTDHTATLWDARTGDRLHTLRGHSQDVTSVAFSPNGSRLLTASWDKTARLWDTETGATLRVLKGHGEGLVTTTFSPDGQRILTGSLDRTAKVWDATTGKKLITLTGHTRDVWWVESSRDGRRLLTYSNDGTTKLWDAGAGTELLTLLINRKDLFNSILLSPDGRRILDRSADGTVELWDTANGERILELEGSDCHASSAVFGPDGHAFLVGTDSGEALLWCDSLSTGAVSFVGHTGQVCSVAFCPIGRRFATGSSDHTAKVWDIKTGRMHHTLAGHEGDVISVAFSPDGSRIFTRSRDMTAKIWDAESGREVFTIGLGNKRFFSSIRFSPDGQSILTTDLRFTVELRDSDTGEGGCTLTDHDEPVLSLALNPDGRHILTGSSDHSTKLWAAHLGEEVLGVTGLPLAYCADRQRILTVSTNQSATLWDAQTGKPISWFGDAGMKAVSAAFSPDGKYLLTTSTNHTATLWETESGKELRTIGDPCGASGPLLAEFSPDGHCVVMASTNQGATVWDTESGARGLSLGSRTTGVLSVAFSPDGDHILIRTTEHTAILRDTRTGRRVTSFGDKTKDVSMVAFSPDGRRILTGSRGTAKLWDAESGKEILTRIGEDAARSKMITAQGERHWRFSPDGRTLISVFSEASGKRGPVLGWPTFPWRDKDYPGDESMPLEERIEMYKREYWRKILAQKAQKATRREIRQ